ncbi:hypothetical protein STREPTOSP366_08400 [Streptomyces variabilis]
MGPVHHADAMTSIDVRDLTKEYGTRRAVDDLTFTVPPGRVTGFLGPNGAGKSTTMRLVLGLDHPTSGAAALGGRPYASLREPLRTVGALLTPAPRSAPAPAATICASWRPRTGSRTAGWPRCWRRPDWLRPPAAGFGRTRSACGSGSASPPRCSATRRW